jgi:hypothetical protein
MRQFLFIAALVIAPIAAQQPSTEHVALPNKPGSVKFAVLGNSGTGEPAQYELAKQMSTFHDRFKYDFVLLAGGNLFGSERPHDFIKKFETPYKPLLDAGVKFQASLGPDDDANQRFYKLFNMDGKSYYSFSPKPEVSFFALDTNYFGPEQIQWFEQELQASKAAWKIAFFHHSLYSGVAQKPAELRSMLEPLLIKYNVAVVMSGQGGIYERVTPQNGIAYFVVGSGGQLKQGGLNKSSTITGKGFDRDQAFLAAEIVGDEMYFMAISREGTIVDAGVVRRQIQ